MKNILIYFMLCLFGLGIQSVQGMPIFVKISSETTITLELSPSDTVDNVKQIIQEQRGITQSQQILYFGTTKLEDLGTLSDYNILSGGTIVLITIHNIISVVSGTGFNIKTGTVVGAEGLDLTPSADFSLTSSLSGSDDVSKSTTNANINKSYRFSETTAEYSGLVKINYQDSELNELIETDLKMLHNDGSTWNIENSSTNDAAANYVSTSFSSKTLNELTLGTFTALGLPELAKDEKFIVMVYINPFSSNFKLGLTTSSLEKIKVSVYDMTGRLIELRNADVSEITNQEIGDNYPSGVYTIKVTQDSDSKTLKVIKR